MFHIHISWLWELLLSKLRSYWIKCLKHCYLPSLCELHLNVFKKNTSPLFFRKTPMESIIETWDSGKRTPNLRHVLTTSKPWKISEPNPEEGRGRQDHRAIKATITHTTHQYGWLVSTGKVVENPPIHGESSIFSHRVASLHGIFGFNAWHLNRGPGNCPWNTGCLKTEILLNALSPGD